MTRDWKEVYQEAHDQAIEDGLSVSEAEQKAEEARVDFESSLIDDAMNRLKEDPNGRRCSMCGRNYETAPEMLRRMQKDDTAELLRSQS